MGACVVNGNGCDVLDFGLSGHRFVNGRGRWNESTHIQPFAMREIGIITLMLKIKVRDNVIVVRDSNPWPYRPCICQRLVSHCETGTHR